MKTFSWNLKYFLTFLTLTAFSYIPGYSQSDEYYTISKAELQNKIKGAWAAQTIGVTYGGPVEFKFNDKYIPDFVALNWSDTMMYHWMKYIPGLYDDIYMDLTFVEVMEKNGIDAPASAHADAYAHAKYWLWHANQQGRYNILHGMTPPASGYWLNNPHADDIDFQIEADFAGIMNPGMPNSAMAVCDQIGHIMNSGDGYYGGLFMATMYSYAFVTDDIKEIINKALIAIPLKSTFHQCIADVVAWHTAHPDNWKTTWQLVEDKWGTDIGCPDGVLRPFNIDAKINAAYVVMGLLYGEGDLGKTMEVAARSGKDADCNPSSAAAIVGTILGYDALPEYWSKGLASIENMDFKYTSTSLNKVYKISYDQAVELIKKNGGKEDGDQLLISKEKQQVAPLEQNFVGYKINKRETIGKKLTSSDDSDLTMEFDGIGVVLTGRARQEGMDKKYALISNEETVDNYKLMVDFVLDGKQSKTMELPLYFIERAHELFFQYEIPNGHHTLTLHIQNPKDKVYLEVGDLISYEKE